MNKCFALVSVLACLCASAQTPVAPLAERLDQARQRWEDAAVTDYVYGFNKFCECHRETPPETLVSVAAAQVYDVRHVMAKTGDTVPAAADNFSLYWTIEDLFALLERASERGATVRAVFDDALGYPQQIFIDYLPDIVGDEVDVRLTRLEAR